MNRLLFVCTGNLCRSPAAEAIFNVLAEERGIPWRAESAGLSAVEGEHVPQHAALALDEVGFYVGEHRARRIRNSIIEEADLILTMTPRQKEKLEGLVGRLAEDKVHTLPGYLGEGETDGISDPHGHPLVIHRASVRQIYGYTEQVVNLLKKSATASTCTRNEHS